MKMIDIKGRLKSLKDIINRMKQGRGIASKLKIFEFKPFSDKQKKFLHGGVILLR